jgi:hypothetical protein
VVKDAYPHRTQILLPRAFIRHNNYLTINGNIIGNGHFSNKLQASQRTPKQHQSVKKLQKN